MTRILRIVCRLYPRWWWRRYGDELLALADDAGAGCLTIVDVARGALTVRLQQRAPGQPPVRDLFCVASGWAPVAMSAAALAAVAVHLLTSGRAPQADEGTAAHLWQLLMAGQLPVIAWFVVRWVPERGRPALAVMAVHVAAMSVAALPVWWFKW